jgi:hypothetical protein
MTLQELKFVIYWVTNNYDVRDIGGWHPTPNQMLEEFLEENKVEEKKDEKE